MEGKSNAQIETALREHYRRERESVFRSAAHAAQTAALAVDAASGRALRDAGMADFAKAVVRFSPRAFWAVPAAVVALALALAAVGVSAHEAQAALVVSGPTLAAACVVCVVRARSCGMIELEAACVRTACAVACARLVVAGGASLLALIIACVAYAPLVSVGAALAYALAPYLVAAAGGMLFARRVASGNAALAALVWSVAVGALGILCLTWPDAYANAALWVWAAIAAAAAVWCAHETVRWLQLVSGARPAQRTDWLGAV